MPLRPLQPDDIETVSRPRGERAHMRQKIQELCIQEDIIDDRPFTLFAVDIFHFSISTDISDNDKN